MTDQSVDALVIQASSGDERALAELFGMYERQLRRMIAFRMDEHLKGRIDPSDVLQETFIDLAKKLPDFEKKNMSFFVWLRLVTHERLLGIHRQHLDAQKRDPRREARFNHQLTGASSVFLAAHLLGRQSSVVGKAIRAEQRARLEAVLNTMDEIDREIIALRIFEGLTNQEACEVLGLDRKASSKRFMKAIDRLRDIVQEIPGLNDR